MATKQVQLDNQGTPENEEKVLTVTDKGLPVEERISTIKAARRLYERTKEAWMPTAKRRARLKGMVDGNPPYDPAKLVEMGLGYMFNVNFLEARAAIDQKAGAFFELFYEVPTLIEVTQRFGADVGQQGVDFGPVVAEEFTTTMHDWTGFLLNMVKARKEADVAGLGVMLWRDEWDWRPKAFAAGNWLPETKAELDVDGIKYFFMRDHMSAGELYRAALKSERIAESEGWDPQAVKDTLISIYNKEMNADTPADRFQTSTWESIQQGIRNNEWWSQLAEFEDVKVLHMLVQEVANSKVSHYIFTENQILIGDKTDKVPEDGFLFRQVERFESMSQVVWMLPFNDGDGYLKSVRGLASMIEPHCDLSNRFLGRVFDAGFTTASLVLQPATQLDVSKLQLVRMGLITVVPPGVNALQSTFQPQIGPLIQLRDLSSSIMKNNTGVWRTAPETFSESQPQKTARQVQYEEGRENRLEKGNVAYDYVQIERLYREIFRRITNKKYLDAKTEYPGQKEARLFIARCAMRGVPVDMLTTPDVFRVTITKAIGMGSWGVKMDLSNQVFAARGVFDEQGQRNATRDWLAVRVGYQNVNRYAPPVNRNTIPSNEASIATLENNDFAENTSVPVGSDQMHAIHAMSHAAPVMQIIQTFAQTRGQSMDIQRAMQTLAQTLPHLETHVQYLSQDPTRVQMVKQFQQLMAEGVKTYKALTKVVAEQIQMQAMQQKQAMQGRQQQMQKMQEQATTIKELEEQNRHQEAVMKLESLNEMRRVKTEEQLQVRREGAAANLQLTAQKQAADIAISAKRAEADIAIKSAKAGAE